MIETGSTYKSPHSSARATVLESWRDNGGARFRLERAMPPNTGKAGAHYHLDFDQRFEVVAGTATMTVEGEQRKVEAGQSVELPRPTKHADPWNEGPEELSIELTIAPVPRFVEVYVETWAEGLASGRLNDQEELPFLQLLLIANETGSQSYGAGPPQALQRAIAPVAAAIARMRGYPALG
jgi:mannose-6-phosphate isomerase-like protein (cupin superfamily)